MPVPRFQLPEIVDGPQVPAPLPLSGEAMPSSFSAAAIVRAESPEAYSVKMRVTMSASVSLIVCADDA